MRTTEWDDPDDMAIYRRVITYLDDVTRDEAATMRGREALNIAINAAVSARGIVPHPNDPAWRKLELGFIRAQRKAVNAIKARLEGRSSIPLPLRSQLLEIR